mgnify:CR=1 FL=1
MSSGHDHSHGGSGSSTARTRLAIAFAITSVIVLAQAIGSVVTGSLALLTDTAHALVDASGLLVALIAATYGLVRLAFGLHLPDMSADLGIDTFIFSGYPHLEESYRVAELLFPHLDIAQPERPASRGYVSPFGEMISSDILPKAAAAS